MGDTPHEGRVNDTPPRVHDLLDGFRSDDQSVRHEAEKEYVRYATSRLYFVAKTFDAPPQLQEEPVAGEVGPEVIDHVRAELVGRYPLPSSEAEFFERVGDVVRCWLLSRLAHLAEGGRTPIGRRHFSDQCRFMTVVAVLPKQKRAVHDLFFFCHLSKLATANVLGLTAQKFNGLLAAVEEQLSPPAKRSDRDPD